MEDWQIVLSIVGLILSVLIPLLIHVKNSNKAAHDQIGKNIGKVEDRVGKVEEKVGKVEEKVDAGFIRVNNDITTLNRSVGRVEGALGGPSENAQDRP